MCFFANCSQVDSESFTWKKINAGKTSAKTKCGVGKLGGAGNTLCTVAGMSIEISATWLSYGAKNQNICKK